MKFIIPTILGYLLGSLSPAALIGKLKKVNLRKSGTGNLGATNTALMMGRRFGFAVMLFDIFKGSLAVVISKLMFAESAYLSGLLAGSSAVIGHMFPFYMKFKGGKGLAAYGGMVLAYEPVIFLILFAVGLVCMIVFKYCVALTVSAAALFPAAVALGSLGSPDLIPLTAIAAATSAVFILRHKDNIARAINGEEPTAKFFFKKLFERKRPSIGEETAKEQ